MSGNEVYTNTRILFYIDAVIIRLLFSIHPDIDQVSILLHSIDILAKRSHIHLARPTALDGVPWLSIKGRFIQPIC